MQTTSLIFELEILSIREHNVGDDLILSIVRKAPDPYSMPFLHRCFYLQEMSLFLLPFRSKAEISPHRNIHPVQICHQRTPHPPAGMQQCIYVFIFFKFRVGNLRIILLQRCLPHPSGNPSWRHPSSPLRFHILTPRRHSPIWTCLPIQTPGVPNR